MFSAKALSLFSLLFKESVDSGVLQRVQNQQCGRNQKTRIEFERCELMHFTCHTQDWSSVIEKPSQTPHQIFVFFRLQINLSEHSLSKYSTLVSSTLILTLEMVGMTESHY